MNRAIRVEQTARMKRLLAMADGLRALGYGEEAKGLAALAANEGEAGLKRAVGRHATRLAEATVRAWVQAERPERAAALQAWLAAQRQ